MPKKRLLFILDEMYSGGPQRALVNLLSIIDRDKFDLEVRLFTKGGVLFNEIPAYVKISFVNPRGLYYRFRDYKISYFFYWPLRVLIRVIFTVTPHRLRKNLDLQWTLYSILTKKCKNHYDLAIAYIEGSCIYYLATKVTAQIKIGRIPTDYQSARFNKKIDLRYFRNLNYIFAVSDKNREILEKVFPEFQDKILVFHSIISPVTIRKKSFIGEGFKDNFNGIRILTIARLELAKGIDLAMETCLLLINRGFKIKWYFLGNGDRTFFLRKIKKMNLMDHFFLLKETSNPYTYLRQSDIYVQPSRYEGKSNAVNEAKALYKKIVITRFPSASDHLQNMKEGIISEMEPESIASAIILIINSPELGKSFSLNLSRNFKGNESEIEKLYQLLE